MSNISLASKVAIAFIRPFRGYLDGYMLLGDSKPKLESDLKEKMENFADKAKQQNPNVNNEQIDYVKDCLIAFNIQMMNDCDRSYENILPSVLESLTLALEAELKKNFTEEELQDILDGLEKTAIKKLLSHTILFGILKQHELELENRHRVAVLEASLDLNSLEKMKKLFKKFKKNHGISDQEDEDDPDLGNIFEDY